MGVILQVDIFEFILVNVKFCILIQISLNCIPKCVIGNKSTLAQVMAWHKTGDKPLPKRLII